MTSIKTPVDQARKRINSVKRLTVEQETV